MDAGCTGTGTEIDRFSMVAFVIDGKQKIDRLEARN
jgi:hypothetical protein